MEEFLNYQTIPSLVSSLISGSIIIYFLAKAKKDAITYSFIAFQVLVFLWPLPTVLHNILYKLHIHDYYAHLFGCNLLYHVVVCFSGTCWLIFCLTYIDSRLLRNNLFKAMVVVLPVVYLVVSMYIRNTMSGEPDILRERLWVVFLTILPYFATGAAILVRYGNKKPGVVKKQTLLLVIGISIPIFLIFFQTVYFLTHIGVYKPIITDYIFFGMLPSGFILSSLVIALTIFRFKFLSITPIALKSVFDTVKEAIVVIQHDRICDANASFQAAFSNCQYMVKNGSADDLALMIEKRTTQSKEQERILTAIRSSGRLSVSGEITFDEPQRRCWFVNVVPVFSRKLEAEGAVVSFSDVTEYKSMMEQLKVHAATAEELAISKERNRLAREMHDTLGHTLTLLLTLIKMCSQTYKTSPVETHKMLTEALGITKGGLSELRHSILGLVPESIDASNFFNSLRNLFKSFETSGMVVEFIVDESETGIDGKLSSTLYRICQEALTNSLRHGKAAKVAIFLHLDHPIKLLIIDNGCGSKDFKAGFGLSGMTERVKELNGQINYGSSEEGGFNIFVRIPNMQEAIEGHSERGHD